MTLKDLPIGKTATIRTVGGEGALRQHFLDMGIIPKAEVTIVKYAPMGDPIEVRVHSYELTLRLADAEKIEIEEVHEEKTHPGTSRIPAGARTLPHPGLGEGGKYHDKADENPLPDGTVLTFARALGEFGATSMLAGNIAGKTGTISQKIANVIKDGDYATAGVWVVIMLVIALAIIVVINMVSDGKGRKQNRW